MDDLNPITRTERLLDGEDLTPTNREEMFIRRIYDKTQEIPEPVNRKEYFLKKAGDASGDVTIEELNVTANGTYTAPQGKAYTPVTVEVQPPANSYQLKSITTPTSLATFEASAMPMPTLKASIKAEQDLHGYDKPWVGGAGKNKAEINITDAALTEITDSDGNKIGFKYNSTTAQSYVITIKVGEVSIKSGKTYTLSGSPSGFGNDSYRLDVRSGSTVYNNWNETNNATITASEDITLSIYIRVASNYAMSQSLIFRPQIEEGSSATTFAPYSNECPISGWSEANVSVCGINYFDKTTIQDGYVNSNTGTVEIPSARIAKCTDFIRVLPNTSYYIKSEQTNGRWGAYYDENKNYVSGVTAYSNRVITTPSNAKYVRLTVLLYDGNIDTFGINYPSTDTAYHAYNGVTATITLGQTVYGGELDVVNGELKVTHGYIASYNGETLPSTWISSMDVYAEGTTPTTGAEVCYELATPTTVSITPSLIKSLNGTNNLSVDCGEILEGTYFKELGGE